MLQSSRFRGTALVVSVAMAWAASGAALAAEPPLVVKRETGVGQEVLVRGFAEFDASCNLVRTQTVSVVTPPRHGTVETRPGPVTIGKNWVGGANCSGQTLQGVNVYYVPAPGFSGSDRFSLDVRYVRRSVHADVDVTVR